MTGEIHYDVKGMLLNNVSIHADITSSEWKAGTRRVLIYFFLISVIIQRQRAMPNPPLLLHTKV